MLEFKDQLGQTIYLDKHPSKIISLVPSLTELLFDLGLGEYIMGVTKYCKYPLSEVNDKLKVGGTKDPDIIKIIQLMPDLVIANKEENIKEHILEIQKYAPVWVSDINNMEDVFAMVVGLGNITNRNQEALDIIKAIQVNFSTLLPFSPQKLKVLYLIWRKPFMTVGGDTFISHMLSLCGWENIYSQEMRYPIVSNKTSDKLVPDIIFLSSEPYPFKEKHIGEVKQLYPDAAVILVDGEFFSWYGSRLLGAPGYLKNLQKKIFEIV